MSKEASQSEPKSTVNNNNRYKSQLTKSFNFIITWTHSYLQPKMSIDEVRNNNANEKHVFHIINILNYSTKLMVKAIYQTNTKNFLYSWFGADENLGGRFSHF